MNYELARKLREAGWNQTPTENGSYYALPVGYTFLMPLWYEKLFQKNIPAKIPTLSELIEACGDSLEQLARSGDGRWHAKRTGSNLSFPSGSTPEEAVANLWLKLNEGVLKK